MHAVTFNYCHESFASTWIRNEQRERGYLLRNAEEYQLPKINLEFMRRMPLYTLSYELNKLGDIRFQRNRETFCISLKNILLGDCQADLRTLSEFDET